MDGLGTRCPVWRELVSPSICFIPTRHASSELQGVIQLTRRRQASDLREIHALQAKPPCNHASPHRKLCITKKTQSFELDTRTKQVSCSTKNNARSRGRPGVGACNAEKGRVCSQKQILSRSRSLSNTNYTTRQGATMAICWRSLRGYRRDRVLRADTNNPTLCL